MIFPRSVIKFLSLLASLKSTVSILSTHHLQTFCRRKLRRFFSIRRHLQKHHRISKWHLLLAGSRRLLLGNRCVLSPADKLHTLCNDFMFTSLLAIRCVP